MTFDPAANLALFLLDRTGSIFGTFRGHLSAKEQRALFGQFLGKGRLVIDGEAEEIRHTVQVCFGMDRNTTASGTWGDLCRGVDLKDRHRTGTAAEIAAWQAARAVRIER